MIVLSVPMEKDAGRWEKRNTTINAHLVPDSMATNLVANSTATSRADTTQLFSHLLGRLLTTTNRHDHLLLLLEEEVEAARMDVVIARQIQHDLQAVFSAAVGADALAEDVLKGEEYGCVVAAEYRDHGLVYAVMADIFGHL